MTSYKKLSPREMCTEHILVCLEIMFDIKNTTRMLTRAFKGKTLAI